MKGEATDGHKFIDKAIAAGAAGILCETAVDHPHVRVTDSAAALNALGVASRARSRARIVGVTGSAGKTGTKEALFAALDRFRPDRKSVGKGKSVSVRVDLGGRRIIKKKIHRNKKEKYS